MLRWVRTHADAARSSSDAANCGSTEQLARCSQCHSAYFCSVRCQRAYWPFHKAWCRRNDFADQIEATEPKFAKWMRKHGKQAVLKDDEVERMERQGHHIIESMYGKANPKPEEPSYSPEEMALMERAEKKELVELAAHKAEPQKSAWDGIDVPDGLGGEVAGRYKWVQNQSYVEAHFLLPPRATARDVDVRIEPRFLRVEHEGAPLLSGELFDEIKVDDSTWLLTGGILTVSLLKSNRRGHYKKGTNNADTYWRSLVTNETNESAVLPIEHVPKKYFFCEYDKEDAAGEHRAIRAGDKRR